MRALRRNKMRSILTALGIIIGVASVVAMVAVGNGAQARITSQVSALGQNLLMVFAGSKKSGGVNSGLGSASAITLEDASAIQREVPDVAAVSPEVFVTAQAIANGRNWSTTVVGESQDYLRIRDWKLAAGSIFNDSDIRSAAKIAVIGSKTAQRIIRPVESGWPEVCASKTFHSPSLACWTAKAPAWAEPTRTTAFLFPTPRR